MKHYCAQYQDDTGTLITASWRTREQAVSFLRNQLARLSVETRNPTEDYVAWLRTVAAALDSTCFKEINSADYGQGFTLKEQGPEWDDYVLGTQERDNIVDWLQSCDRNGCYSDYMRSTEGFPPLTYEQARAAMIRAINDDDKLTFAQFVQRRDYIALPESDHPARYDRDCVAIESNAYVYSAGDYWYVIEEMDNGKYSVLLETNQPFISESLERCERELYTFIFGTDTELCNTLSGAEWVKQISDIEAWTVKTIIHEIEADPTLRLCSSFGSLHDYCDANCLGGLCDEEEHPIWWYTLIDEDGERIPPDINGIQDAVHRYLSEKWHGPAMYTL